MKVFGAVAAIDLGGVDAVAAFHEVGAVARIPDHAVVAGLAEHLVVAGAADQRVVAIAAEQQIVAALAEQDVVARPPNSMIVAGAAGQRVVAGAAEQLGGGQRAVGFVERDRVVAAWPNTWIMAVLATVGCAARDWHGAAVDENVTGRIAAGDDGVVEAVVESPTARRSLGKK